MAIPGSLAAFFSCSCCSRRRPTANTPRTSRALSKTPAPSGIGSAKIDLVNLATQVSATTTSDTSGNYRFLSLAPGTYKVTAEAQGFKRAEKTVTLQTNQTLDLPLTLEVGAVSETVTDQRTDTARQRRPRRAIS